jgi:hypothetical protein
MGQIMYTVAGFTFFFVFLLGLYGYSTGQPAIVDTVSQITGAWPTVSTNNCSFSSAGPAGSCNILDTAELGAIWTFSVIGSVLYRIGAMFYLIYQIFSILNAFSSFPFLGWFFGFLLFILGVESYKLMRSGHSA